MLIKPFSKRVKFFLKLVSWKLADTPRTETVSGFLISFLGGLDHHRDAKVFGETQGG